MATLHYGSWIIAIFLSLLTVASAWKEQTLSTFIYTRYGDRQPFARTSKPELTALGAQQLYHAGASIRNRYITATNMQSVTGPVSTIRSISTTSLVNTQLSILSTSDQWVTASAQAFLQGLYPPILSGSNVTSLDGMITLANGSMVGAPLNGYQYPAIRTVSSIDYRSVYLQGMNNCPAYTAAMMRYYNTSQYETLLRSSQPFYDGLKTKYLNYAFDDAAINFNNAYYIWDYLNYIDIHEQTGADSLTAMNLSTARSYASNWVLAMYANTSSDGKAATNHLEAIAGRGLVYRVLQQFYNSINSGGSTNMMNLMFGSFEPMVSFAALAGLMVPQDAAFYNIPEAGSSFIFELFSMLPETASDNYPSTSDMFVRFLYQNGTDEYSKLVEYPLFGSSPSQTVMSLSDFTNSLSRISIGGVEDWCNTCGSSSIFCPGFTDNTASNSNSAARKGHVSPVIGGVIGALVTLLCALLLLGLFMLFGGFRIHKVERKRRSELGGFKGAEKLRSDQDLTLPKSGVNAVVTETTYKQHSGHERVGSWELHEQAKDIESHTPGLTLHNDVAGQLEVEEDDIHTNPFAAPVQPESVLDKNGMRGVR